MNVLTDPVIARILRGLPWGGLVLAALLLPACGQDGVTADCPAMPLLDPTTGEPVVDAQTGEPVDDEWTDPTLGAGGALDRWRRASAAAGCTTSPSAGAGAPSR